MLIDSKAVKPILDRANYVKVSITGIQLVEKPQRLEISTAIVGVIIAYMTEGLPQQVTVDGHRYGGSLGSCAYAQEPV